MLVSAEMLNFKLMSTQSICTLYDVLEITNGQPWQNSSQNSVFWRGAECHCQKAKFLLHKYKKLLKVSLNWAEYAITRKEHYSFLA